MPRGRYALDSGKKVCAQKRTCLGELPQTLVIQLKRFQLVRLPLSTLRPHTHVPSMLPSTPCLLTRRSLVRDRAWQDYETMANVKLNSLMAFPPEIDLEPFTKHGLEARASGRSAARPEMYAHCPLHRPW